MRLWEKIHRGIDGLLIIALICLPLIDFGLGIFVLPLPTSSEIQTTQSYQDLFLNGTDELDVFYQTHINDDLPTGNSWNSPYIISNVKFTGDFFLYLTDTYIIFEECIFTLGIQRFFNTTNTLIRNSKFIEVNVVFLNASNIALEKNYFSGKIANIVVSNTQDMVIHGNFFFHIEKNYPILIKDCKNINISKNTIRNCEHSVSISYCTEIFLQENIFRNDYTGVYLEENTNISLIANKFWNIIDEPIILRNTDEIVNEENEIGTSFGYQYVILIREIILSLAILWIIIRLFYYWIQVRFIKERYPGNAPVKIKHERESDNIEEKTQEYTVEKSVDMLFQPGYGRKFQIWPDLFYFIAISIVIAYIIAYTYGLFFKIPVMGYIFGKYPIRVDITAVFSIIVVIGTINLSVLEYRTQWMRYAADADKEHFRQLDLEKIFGNESRWNLLDIILENPYIHYADLKRRTHHPNATLQYHLQVLQKAHLIKSKKVGQYRAYIPYKFEHEIPTNILNLMKSPETLAIYRLIYQTPGITINQLATLMEKRPNSITYHLKRLSKDELIREERENRVKKFYIKKEISILINPLEQV